MFNRRLVLWALCLATAASVPSRAAQSIDLMTPVPADAVLAAVDADQGTPDAACVARCATARGREIASADALLKNRGYWWNGDSNCWAPNCAAVRQTCREACGPKDSACLNACETPFQSCCAAGAKATAQENYDSCVRMYCPVSKAPVTQPPTQAPRPSMAGDLGKGATIDKKTAWTAMLKSVNTMVDALGPSIEGLDLARFNDLRRALAFMQVRASMTAQGAKYAVVSGGAGRIWVILASGQQILLNDQVSKVIRGQGTAEDWSGEDLKAHAEVARLAGLSFDETWELSNSVRAAERQGGFAPGETFQFPPWQGWPTGAVASSEHGSIRGTINGGGEFI